jgi:hypothetical protein
VVLPALSRWRFQCGRANPMRSPAWEVLGANKHRMQKPCKALFIDEPGETSSAGPALFWVCQIHFVCHTTTRACSSESSGGFPGKPQALPCTRVVAKRVVVGKGGGRGRRESPASAHDLGKAIFALLHPVPHEVASSSLVHPAWRTLEAKNFRGLHFLVLPPPTPTGCPRLSRGGKQ